LGQIINSKNDEAKILFNKITKFIDKVKYIKENFDLKSGEELSVDSTLWYLSAGFNLENSEPDGSYISFYRDSVFIQIPFVNGFIDIKDIVNAYSLLEFNASQTLESAPFENKEQKFTYFIVKSLNDNNMTLKSTTVVGEKGVAEENPFGPGDYWWFGNDNGKCFEISDDVDAGDLICDAINENRPLHVPDEGKIIFYVNPVTVQGPINALSAPSYFINPNDETENDNILDYLLFYATQGNCNGCNMWDYDEYYCIKVNEGGSPYYNDMNFYYNSTTQAIYDLIPNKPGNTWGVHGKTFMDIEEIYGYDDSKQENTIFIHNLINITYATRIVIEE